MQLFDSSKGRMVEFAPGKEVTIYTCGLTPYDATHIGHAATYLTFDVLQRRLRDLGHKTKLVRNVTDVDDDILRKAKELGVNYQELGEREIAKFNADMIALNLLPAFSEPPASSAIDEIKDFTSKVIAAGHAYEVEGNVYFDVNSWPKFGSLFGLDRETMLKFAAERGGYPEDTRKRDPLDFVMWQLSAEGEPSWESEWGAGRPGWHIECSVLAQRELGDVIDIHGGGSDLMFPHHECEAAQTEALTGKPFVKLWMHQAMVRMDGEKMSKSLGNMEFVSELLLTHDARALRLAILANHYRTEWEWTNGLLADSGELLNRWVNAVQSSKPNEVEEHDLLERVRGFLDNDLDTPSAISAVDMAASQGVDVSVAAELLGVELS